MGQIHVMLKSTSDEVLLSDNVILTPLPIVDSIVSFESHNPHSFRATRKLFERYIESWTAHERIDVLYPTSQVDLTIVIRIAIGALRQLDGCSAIALNLNIGCFSLSLSVEV